MKLCKLSAVYRHGLEAGEECGLQLFAKLQIQGLGCPKLQMQAAALQKGKRVCQAGWLLSSTVALCADCLRAKIQEVVKCVLAFESDCIRASLLVRSQLALQRHLTEEQC